MLQIAASFLLADARTNEATYELMNKECVFPRLVDLISKQTGDEQAGLHRLLMELLYEMSRVQKIKAEDLCMVFSNFLISEAFTHFNPDLCLPLTILICSGCFGRLCGPALQDH